MTTSDPEHLRSPDAGELIARSVRKYRRSHRRYGRRHPEIFNPVEQARLRLELRMAFSDLGPEGRAPRILDLGCGTGNVTDHLRDLGANVIAGDVSPEFLRTIQKRYGLSDTVEVMHLNGRDLAGIEDGGLDGVCAFSVLHHIPDYLGMIDEICRVLRPGGVAYLDHEVNDNVWDKQSCFWAMMRAIQDARVRRQNWWNRRDWWDPTTKRWQRFLLPSKYVMRFRQALNPAYPWDVEGDIHVWEHDHVEWEQVAARLERGGCVITRCVDYLNYSSEYPDDVWERFRGECSDMRLVVARKSAGIVASVPT